ncbi:MAG TPA: RAMP superfamily CRISPR-associated protein, partial [Thermoanaerobaculia bacterium]|nr:RAMP superfamily CRISPR-associated protein [Thermoanaerobaculia bacterium]
MPRLRITLRGHLLVAGGQSSDLGIDLSTARRFDGNRWVPYIPATALRGAVRIQLESLLAGDERPGTDPYRVDREKITGTPELEDPVARLFGFSGPTGERDRAREGALRFSDALPVDGALAASAFGVRPGVQLEDYTASAEDRKLYFREVAEITSEPLVFQAWLAVDPSKLQDGDFEALRAAVETTESIGAGKSKGGGDVAIEWLEEDDDSGARVDGSPAGATRARLLLTLLEPAHFGDGGPQRNHHATRGYVPGATLRGAIAWALLRADRTRPDSAGFKSLFLEGPPASFGDALLVHDSGHEPVLLPATARESRARKELRDVLVSELARERVNRVLEEHGKGLYLRADDGDDRLDPVSHARPASGLVRRTRTRVSIDRWTGTAEDGRLFSIEQLEPWLSSENGGAARPVRFVSWVEGLTQNAADLLAQVAGLPILLGAGRNHGLGLVRMEVRFEKDSVVEPLRTIRTLGRRIDEQAAQYAALAGCSAPGPSRTLPLVLVALSDYVPTGRGDAAHPLAEPEAISRAKSAFEPARRFLNPGWSGG